MTSRIDIRRSAHSSSPSRWGLLFAAFLAAAMLVVGDARQARAADIVETPAADAPIVYHHPERYAGTVEKFEQRAGDAIRTLKKRLQIDDIPTIAVWILPTVNAYFEHKGQPERAPEWAIGISLTDQQTVVVAHDTELPGGNRPELSATFVHELAHVAIDLARDGNPVPRWFNEGFCLWVAEEWTNERNRTLSRAASTDSLIRLSELTDSFPGHHKVASLAYAQSYHLVRRIGREFGSDTYGRILERVADGTPFDEAFREVSGVRLGSFEHRWREELTEGSSWWTILMEDGLIFFGGGVVFVLAYIIVRRRRRREFDDMEDSSSDSMYDRSKYPLPGDPES